ncbi:transposase [Streptomyces sp. NPDC059718]
MRSHKLSDAEREFVRQPLPHAESRRKRRDDRMILKGIVWKFRRSAWRDVSERYRSWATLHTRFRGWAADGTFDRMLRALQATTDVAGAVDWMASVDSTIVQAHQQAAGPRKLGSAARDLDGREAA